MSIGGEKGNGNSSVVVAGLKIGATTGTPLVVNPTPQQMKDILGFNSAREIEYTSKKDGVKQVRLDIWFKDSTSGRKYPLTIWLGDEVVKNKHGKIRYVNSQGSSHYWIEEGGELQSWFTKCEYWPARQGEVELYRFIKAYTDILKTYETFTRTVDWSRLIKGDVSEINNIIGAEFTNSVLFTLTIRMRRVEGAFKPLQSVYNTDFLPGDFIRFVDGSTETESNQFRSYLSQLTHPEHGCKEFFGEGRVLRRLHDYDPSKHPVATDAPIIAGAPGISGAQAAVAASFPGDGLDDDIAAILDNDDDIEEADLEY